MAAEDQADQFSIHRANLFPLGYKDFNKSEYPYHTLASFNWEDHAFSVLHKYSQAGANCVNR